MWRLPHPPGGYIESPARFVVHVQLQPEQSGHFVGREHRPRRLLAAHAVVIATGARYRKLDVQRLDEFEGTSVYYAATPVEARMCAGDPVVVGSDGECVVAVLDRNGFRPCRYDVTRDHQLILASEVGVLDRPASQLRERGRLGPGQMLVIDPARGGLIEPEGVRRLLCGSHYGSWLRRRVRLSAPAPAPQEASGAGGGGAPMDRSHDERGDSDRGALLPEFSLLRVLARAHRAG